MEFQVPKTLSQGPDSDVKLICEVAYTESKQRTSYSK